MKSREKEDAQVPARPLASVAAFGTSQGLAMVMGLLMQVMAARNLLPADYARFVVANTVVLALTLGLTSCCSQGLGSADQHRSVARRRGLAHNRSGSFTDLHCGCFSVVGGRCISA